MNKKYKGETAIRFDKDVLGGRTALVVSSQKLYHQQPGSCIDCDVKCGSKLCGKLGCGEWAGSAAGTVTHTNTNWKLNPVSSCEPFSVPCEG